MRSPSPSSQGPCPAAKGAWLFFSCSWYPRLDLVGILHDSPLFCRETHCPANHRGLGSGPRPHPQSRMLPHPPAQPRPLGMTRSPHQNPYFTKGSRSLCLLLFKLAAPASPR